MKTILITGSAGNVGSDIEIAVLDLEQKNITITNSKSQIIYLPALEEGDMLRRCPDTTKMKTLLGRESISLENGIKKLVEHYENRN
ncbi:hypothetical protein [Flavobacterium johnsoniae]|uniref:Uncharacterized protein n=1 Tax=Flavobacterium johnsoniae TaxID=986 RepID=A0A1J7CNN0_FLAJO|nr:hypothetical protein [Flavobacterium johnsoniae]OIV43180.1 hypothetical protein BKM63_02925 [Flavobacterium johnsoniae]